MEPTLQLLSDNASMLLEGTDPNEQPTKSFKATLDDEKKKYHDTLASAMAAGDMLKSGDHGYYGYTSSISHNIQLMSFLYIIA